MSDEPARRRGGTPGGAGSPTRIVYVAGMGRSGSTILEQVLSAHGPAFSVGEICFVWSRGVVRDTVCACGSWFSECPFWQAVMDVVATETGTGREGPMEALGRATAASFRRFGTLWGLPRLLRLDRTGGTPPGLRSYRDTLSVLYEAVARVSGSRLLVDSSKYPGYALILDGVPGLEVHPVHLVRDSRSVARSWLKEKTYFEKEGHVEPMERHSSVGSALRWWAYNVGTELCGARMERRPRRVRFEDFVDAPARTVRGVWDFVGEPAGDVFSGDGRVVRIPRTHGVAGNPSRFDTGARRIRRGRGWRERMARTSAAAVSALTFPLLRRYGYRVVG